MREKKKLRLKAWQIVLLSLIALFILYVGLGWNHQMKVQRYTLTSDKVTAPVRFVAITDFHSNTYGEGQSEILSAVAEEHPDAVLLVGDIFDERKDHEPAFRLIEALGKDYTCYFVTGNHDYWTEEIDGLLPLVEQADIRVLHGEIVLLEANGQTVQIAGLDDPEGEYYASEPLSIAGQISTIEQNLNSQLFSVLLYHRPEQIERLLGKQLDLVVSGHAHGGQWIVPGIFNGIYAPHQGLFPRYAGGRYDFADGTTMIVSRGLERETTKVPRLFNQPELLVIDIVPQKP